MTPSQKALVSCWITKESVTKINMKHFIYILLFTSLFSCSSLNKKNIESNIENNMLGFNEFYKILLVPTVKKEKFTLSESKTFDLKIINNGTKNLFIPSWFDLSSEENSELYIALYKKNGDIYELYKQVSGIVITNRQSSTDGREILFSKNGNPVCINNIDLDSFLKIVDSGEFFAKISIDLSDFGYFKILNTDLFFEVVN